MKTVTISARGQVAIPKEIRGALHIKEGDKLILELKDGKILLEPAVAINIPRSQAWFWSEEIQEEIKESEKDFRSGNSRVYKNIDKLIDDLNDD